MSNLKNGHRERKLKKEHRARCRAANLPCSHCRQPIDYDAPANSPTAFESDHRIPVKIRPDLAYVASNLIASCCSCNRSRGTKPMHDPGAWVVADW